jgi:hypothetical protein
MDNRDENHKVLVFLTRDGHKGGVDCCCLSYKSDIVGWVDAVIPLVDARNVQHVLKQYRNLVLTLVNTEVRMSRATGNRDMFAFLERPENLRSGLEIADLVESLRDELVERDFWQELRGAIQKWIDANEPKDWTLDFEGKTEDYTRHFDVFLLMAPTVSS